MKGRVPPAAATRVRLVAPPLPGLARFHVLGDADEGRAGERGDRVRVCDVEAEHGAGEAVLVLGLAELLLHVPP